EQLPVSDRCSRSTLRDSADEALEVFGLEAARRDGVVGCLAALLEDLDGPAGLLGHLAEQIGEQFASDLPRTGARRQDAVGCEDVERGEVEANVALEGPLDVLGLPGVLGRVGDD